MKLIIKIILPIIFLSVFIYSGYKVYTNIKEENENNEINNNLVEQAITKIDDEQQPSSFDEQQTSPLKVDFSVLTAQNEDVVGWIYCPNTPINYPILQSDDNDYYLRRLINGKYNSSGSIFMDYRNSSNLEDKRTIIYGHNMKNSSMFGTLPKYKEQKYYDANKIMYIYTPQKDYILEIFAGYTTSDKSDIYNNLKTVPNQTNEDDPKYIKQIKEKSDFKTDVEITNQDNIVILSTCSYEYKNARYVLFGKIIKK